MKWLTPIKGAPASLTVALHMPLIENQAEAYVPIHLLIQFILIYLMAHNIYVQSAGLGSCSDCNNFFGF